MRGPPHGGTGEDHLRPALQPGAPRGSPQWSVRPDTAGYGRAHRLTLASGVPSPPQGSSSGSSPPSFPSSRPDTGRTGSKDGQHSLCTPNPPQTHPGPSHGCHQLPMTRDCYEEGTPALLTCRAHP